MEEGVEEVWNYTYIHRLRCPTNLSKSSLDSLNLPSYRGDIKRSKFGTL